MSYVNDMSYVNYMSYVSYMSHVSYMIYVDYMSYLSYVSHMNYVGRLHELYELCKLYEYLMNHFKSFEIAWSHSKNHYKKGFIESKDKESTGREVKIKREIEELIWDI